MEPTPIEPTPAGKPSQGRRIREYFHSTLQKNPKILRQAGWGVLGLFAVLFLMSFLPAFFAESVQDSLEKGDLPVEQFDWNPLDILQAGFRHASAARFEQALDHDPVDPAALKSQYLAAVCYLSYRPRDTEALSAAAYYYFLQGYNLSAESLALKSLALDPMNLRVRRYAVLCQALPFDLREKLLNSSWIYIAAQEGMIKYLDKAKPKIKALFLLGKIVGLLWAPKDNPIHLYDHLSVFNFRNREWKKILDREEEWTGPEYAFSLFLTDPLKWKNDAMDCLDDQAVTEDPRNLEHRYVVASWVAEWNEDPAALASELKDLNDVKLPEPDGQKRLEFYRQSFESLKGYDRQVEALNSYASRHSENASWVQLETDAMKIPPSLEAQPADTGETGWAMDFLNKVQDGTTALTPGMKKQDYDYPQPAEVKKSLDDALQRPSTLVPCPVLMPLRDDQGRMTPLGGYLGVLAMTSACFPGKEKLGFWEPFGLFKDYCLLGNSARAHDHALDEMMAFSGAGSYAEGSLVDKEGKWWATLNFHGPNRAVTYTQAFPKDGLHLIPGWMAQRTYDWLGIRLTRTEKARLAKPIFPGDGPLQRAMVLDNFQGLNKRETPGFEEWDPQKFRSPFVLYRIFESKWEKTGISDLAPMEKLLKKDPDNDMDRYFLANVYNREWMIGKALDIQFAFLHRDQANSFVYSDLASDLKAVGDYGNARYLYEKMAALFSGNALVQWAAGDFFSDYAWTARGDGYADTIAPWNKLLFDKRMGTARRYLEKSETLNPKDPRLYNGLIVVGKAQSWSKEEMDKTFNQSVSIDPDYYLTYWSRLDTLKPEWFGSLDQATAFADKWKGTFPHLKIEAIQRTASDKSNGDTPAYYRYLGSPQVWPEYNELWHEQFQKILMDDYSYWTQYAYEAANADKVQDFLSFLRLEAKTDVTLNDYMPYLVCLVYDYRAQVVGWKHDGQLYLNSPQVWPEIHQAALQAIQQDPDNYTFMNNRAQEYTGWGRFKSARTLFKLIGDHWNPDCWSRKDFELYRKIANHQEEPSWHLCLSTAEAAEER